MRSLLIIDPGVQLWGSEQALAATLCELVKDWDRISLLTPKGAALKRHLEKNAGALNRIRRLTAPIGLLHKRGPLARGWALAYILVVALTWRPTHIYLNQAGLARIVGLVATCLRLELIIHVRIAEDIPTAVAVARARQRHTRLVFVSESMSEMAALDKADGIQWLSVYDPFEFECEHVPEEGGRAGLPAANFKVAFVGRLAHLKGPHHLLQAVSLMGDAQLEVSILGEGVEGDPYAADLRRDVTALGLGEVVSMPGFVEDVSERLRGQDVLISTSYYEPLGRVVMEAWDAGIVPVAYSGSGGAAEMIRASGGGVLYDSWDPEGVAQGIRCAMEMSPDERVRVVTAGRTWAKSELAIGRYVQKLQGTLFPRG